MSKPVNIFMAKSLSIRSFMWYIFDWKGLIKTVLVIFLFWIFFWASLSVYFSIFLVFGGFDKDLIKIN